MHSVRLGALTFNPGVKGAGRFHPFSAGKKCVPTLYGGNTLAGAISETIFHNVPVRGPNRRVQHATVSGYVASFLETTRELRLVRLHSTGLRRLKVSRVELIESDADRYDETVLWAKALHAWTGRADGLLWVSRQDDTSKAIMLFGDRVDPTDLKVAASPLPLGFGRGFDEVLRIAEESDITVVMPL